MEEGSCLFAVCPPGGCFADFTDAERAHAQVIHTGLSVIVRRRAPAKGRLSASPLALLGRAKHQAGCLRPS